VQVVPICLYSTQVKPVCVCVSAGGGVNGSSVPAGVSAVAGGGLMMLNSAVNPAAASGLLMPNGVAAGNPNVLMHRPVMLPSAGSPAAAGYLLAGGAGTTSPALLPQYVLGYPQQSGTSPDLTAAYGPANPYSLSANPYGVSANPYGVSANPYGVSMPPTALYG